MIGQINQERERGQARLCGENVVAALEGRLPDNCVNPEVEARAAWLVS